MSRRTTRRKFLQAGAVTITAPGLLRSATAAGAKRRKPNLLFLWTDEQRADTMAAYGNRRIHAPNLNRLADQSTVFRNAYVTQPVCTPNRAAVMTGLWPHTCGCTTNNTPLPTDVPCLNELVGDNDYRTAYMGKWHLGDEIFAQHGFDEWVGMEDGYTGYYGDGRDRKARSDYHHWLADRGYKPGKNNTFSRGFAAGLPLEHCKPKFLEKQACDFLRRNQSEPFMLNVNFLEPHMPFTGPLNEEHAPEEVTLPPNFDDPLEENEPLRYRLLQAAYKRQYPNEQTIHNLIRKYWGLVTQVDRSVGVILDTLEQLGLADSTIVVYTSDHGDMMGSHHLVAKTVMYEESTRVPWLIRAPGQTRQQMVERPVSQIDLVPTLLDLMGSEAGEALPGKSLVPSIRENQVIDDHVFIEWNPGCGFKAPKQVDFATREEIKQVEQESTRSVVSPDGWKLCLSDLDKGQLFNLRRDPYETTNLFDMGQHDDVITRLTKRIHSWQESVDDQVEVG
jgi:choline-sulfatase